MIIKPFLSNVLVAFSCALFLCSCVATTPKTHMLSVAPDQQLPITIQLPAYWALKFDKPQQLLTLNRTSTQEQATITAKKLDVEEMNLKLLKVFGRINIKEQFDDNWIQQYYTDDFLFDGNQAIKYTFEKEKDTANIYYVGKGQHVYIIRITAPSNIFTATTQTIHQNVHLAKETNLQTTQSIPTNEQPYTPNKNIQNLTLNDLDSVLETYKKNAVQAMGFTEQLTLLEQICFRYAFYKSESFFCRIDAPTNTIPGELKALLQKHPDNPALARCDALMAYINNGLAEAVTKLQVLITKNPEDIHAKLYLSLIRPYDTSLGAETIDQGIHILGENTLTTYLQSKLYLSEGKEREAQDLLKAAFEKNKQNGWLLFSVARIYQVKGDLEKARDLYLNTLELCPNFIPAMYNLAFIHYKENKSDSAQKYLDTILAYQHNNPDALLLQGLLYKKNNQNDAAKAAFEAVLTISPDNYRALYNMGALCATKLNDTNCARLAFSQYIKVAPTNNRHASIISWLKKN